MSIEKSRAIVLRVVDFSNTSCVVTLLTRDFGKLGGLAKGARRRNSPFEGALDVLSICHVVFVHKSGDALDILTEAKLERRFRAAARDLGRLYAAYYAAELSGALTESADPQPELFDLLEATIVALDEDAPVEPVTAHFELRALALVGQAPNLQGCTVCGRAIGGAGPVWLGLISGGLVCSACRPGKQSVVQIDRTVLRWLRQLADSPAVGEGESAVGWGVLRGLLNAYLSHALGFRPRLQAYLNWS